MSEEFNILTSLRSDQILLSVSKNESRREITPIGDRANFYLLDFHRDRLVQACRAFERESKALTRDAGVDNLERQLHTGLSEFLGGKKQEAPVKVNLLD